MKTTLQSTLVDLAFFLQYSRFPHRRAMLSLFIPIGENPLTQSETLNEIRSEPRLAQALEHVTSLLVPGETIEACAVQRRVYALTHRRALIAATSGRFIGVQRGVFGGFHPTSVRWQDLKEARIDVGMLAASLTIIFFGSPDLAIAGNQSSLTFIGLRKMEAESVYRVCQAQDQAWREKRRIRELEEMRARSGGIQLAPGAAAGSGLTAPGGAPDNAAARLEQAKAMLDKGLISDSEFEALKARIVNTL